MAPPPRRPPFLRRLRAALRRLAPGGGIDGFVDGCVAGEIRGWAMDPRQPSRRVHVVALCEGRVAAETLADLSRMDLVQDGRGDGRHAFRLRLPAWVLDGEPRRVEVQALRQGAPVRLLRGEIDIAPPAPAEDDHRRPHEAAGPAGAGGPAEPTPALRLVVWPGEDAAAAATTDASWRAQAWPGLDPVPIGAPAELAALPGMHTVLFAPAGDVFDPAAAGLVTRSRPLADVLTWDGSGVGQRRPEARPLGLLLGESLGGRFAVRGPAFRLLGDGFVQALAAGDRGKAERLLALRPELRWAHLPGPVTMREAAAETGPPDPARAARGGFIPEPAARSLSIGLWPSWSADSAASLTALLLQASAEAGLELLVDADAAAEVRDIADTLAPGRVNVRAVDPPENPGPGAWLATLGAAASGEVVLICQSGVRLGASGLEQIAAWALSPMTGAITVPIRREGRLPLAGLALTREASGWSLGSAHEPRLEGRRRPVLAAPASFMAIGRAKLAILGGAADQRLPAGGADLDLALRLRRLGLASVLLGDLFAETDQGCDPSGETSGAALAAFDPDELAAAAAAFPAPAGS